MSKPSLSTSIPQPRVRPLLGNAPDLGSEVPLQNMMKLAREFGPIFGLSFPGGAYIRVISSHELVADACDETRFEKHLSQALKHLRALAGDGLFTAKNDEPNWGKAHRLLMPAFSPAAMRDYFDDMLDVAEQLFTRWERFGPRTDIDVSDNMTRLTLDTIALCGFAFRFNSFYQKEMHPFVDSMVRALSEAGERTRRVPLQTQLMRRTQRQFQSDIGFMQEVTRELIVQRRALPPEQAPRDLLGLMLNAKDPLTGETLDDDNITHQLVTFLVAGHETTSGLLSFAIYLLLSHPEVLERAQAEVDRVFGDGPPRFEQLAQLQYIDQILRETLRLWPTAPVFALHAKEDNTLLGGVHPVGVSDTLLVLIPMLHRDPTVWKDPERFNPDRFAPEVRDSIPPHAWKPFGNGQRACIGRSFALQEATLVLGMMLQRFHLSVPAPYTLSIRETLTLKPDGLKIRARLRKSVTRAPVARPAARPATPESRAPEKKASHGTRLLMLYGSNSGASEAFARRIASDGLARGYTATVAPLDEYAGKLPAEGAVILVTASYNGHPPDNAIAFHAWLSEVPEGSLKGVRYAVFGCGNRDWAATYQAVPTFFDERLGAAGAQALVARGEADARGDFFGDFEHWYATFWEGVGKGLGVASHEVAAGPLYTVEMVPSASADLVKQNKLELSTLVENRELVDTTSPFGRSKRHLLFKLPEGVTYAAGDYLAVLPENHPELVERAARRFGVRTDAAVVLNSTRGEQASSLPTGQPVSVQELLGRHVELTAPATRKDLARLAEKNPCPPHAMHLAALAQDAERYKEILDKRVSVLDLLEQYTSCLLTFGDFLELLPAMRVRQYSVSSSPRADPTLCTLTVAVVDADAWSGQGRFRGTCSSYLARLRPGEQVAVAVRTPNVPFHPPAANATPIILVSAGTGLAPFRGFIQDRALRHAGGEAAGPALLFFGCDHSEVDFLYREELAGWEQEGVVKVLPAFFRQPDGDVMFVQHRLWKEREQVKALLAQGASFFICGDGRLMAPAVRETLGRIHQESVGCTEEEASAWLADMEGQGRLVADVFS